MLGKPAATVNPDTLDVEEWWQVYAPIGEIQKELPEVMMALPPDAASVMVRHHAAVHDGIAGQDPRPAPKKNMKNSPARRRA